MKGLDPLDTLLVSNDGNAAVADHVGTGTEWECPICHSGLDIGRLYI